MKWNNYLENEGFYDIILSYSYVTHYKNEIIYLKFNK